jgi:hypothetical protein
MMTHEDFQNSVRALKTWTHEEIERLLYAGTRPVSICGTVEAATREAAIARGNAIAHSAEIEEIEALSRLCDRVLERETAYGVNAKTVPAL